MTNSNNLPEAELIIFKIKMKINPSVVSSPNTYIKFNKN
jgi:hypothetical protein